MPLVFELIQYTATTLWKLLHKVARLAAQSSQDNDCYSAACLHAAFSRLHRWTHDEDINHYFPSLGIATPDKTIEEGDTTRPLLPSLMSEPTFSTHSLAPSLGTRASSTIGSGSGSGKKHRSSGKRSDTACSENYTRSHSFDLNHHLDALLGDEAEPALTWATGSTINSSSDLDFDPIQGALQLIPDSHAIDTSTIPPPTLTCRFWFLDCAYASSNEAEWKEHNLAHLRGHVPPLSMTCPLCDMTFNIPDPAISWAANMSHLVQHFRIGDTMQSALPEYVLVRHLWAKRIISDADYQELVSWRSRSKERRGNPYLIIEGRERRQRDRRGYAVPQSRM